MSDYQESLSNRIHDLENYYADSVLTGNLKELYTETQQHLENFRYEIFLKNLDKFEETLVFLL